MLQNGLAFALLLRRARRTLSALQAIPNTAVGLRAASETIEADFMMDLVAKT